MRAIERAGYLAHARTGAFQRHLERARQTITEGLRLCQHPFVGFSAGKDSSCLLWLVLEQQPDALARILNGGETRILLPAMDTVLAWWRDRFPALRLEEVLIDRVFAPGWEQVGFWEQYETFVGEWDRYLNPGADGVFLGLRAAESKTRALSLRRRLPGQDLVIYRYCAGEREGLVRICPLDRWTDDDVAALMVSEGLPLLDPYQAGGLSERTHNRLGRTAMRMGQLLELRRRDPAGYNRLIQRFPELANEKEGNVR